MFTIDTDTPVYVAGMDISRATIKNMMETDKILLEIDGRLNTADLGNPLISQCVWDVIENTDEYIKLYCPKLGRMVVLNYCDMLPATEESPAVFVLDDFLDVQPRNSKKLYVVPQLVGQRCQIDVVDNEYRPAFGMESWSNEILMNLQARRAVIKKISAALRGLDVRGWKATSLCRFSLRSGVPVNIVDAFRRHDLEEMKKVSTRNLVKLLAELRWFRLRQRIESGFAGELFCQ